MGKQPSSAERNRTHAEALRDAVAAMLAEQRKWLDQQLIDMRDYISGANEQLMFQQGQMMTVQGAMLQYLDEQLAPGAHASITSIVEQNIAKAKAEREAKEAEANEFAAAKAKRDAEANEALAALADETPADIAPEAPAVAPADTPTN